MRWSGKQKLVVISNFDAKTTSGFNLTIPASIIKAWGLKNGSYTLKDALYGTTATLKVAKGVGTVQVTVAPLQSFIYVV